MERSAAAPGMDGVAVNDPASAGIVVIGRNEGDRLKACLGSLPAGLPVVYVDSGSSDDSVAFARASGVTVVELPADSPFTAALARNAGLRALQERNDAPPLVQMIDGDCTLDAGWLAAGTAALLADEMLAVVFGRRRERFRERSVYNQLCDDEWNVPVGEVNSCGGDALFRRSALAAAGGYEADMIAGEEPDLCCRLRANGWTIRRIDAEMTRHDAAMTRFRQWWKRTERSGHAFAELHWRHGRAGDPDWGRQLRSMAMWGALLPVAIVATAAFLSTAGAAVLAMVYPVQIGRIARRLAREGHGLSFALAAAGYLVLGKLPQAIGALRFHVRRLTGRRARLIEYKHAQP